MGLPRLLRVLITDRARFWLPNALIKTCHDQNGVPVVIPATGVVMTRILSLEMSLRPQQGLKSEEDEETAISDSEDDKY